MFSERSTRAPRKSSPVPYGSPYTPKAREKRAIWILHAVHISIILGLDTKNWIFRFSRWDPKRTGNSNFYKFWVSTRKKIFSRIFEKIFFSFFQREIFNFGARPKIHEFHIFTTLQNPVFLIKKLILENSEIWKNCKKKFFFLISIYFSKIYLNLYHYHLSLPLITKKNYSLNFCKKRLFQQPTVVSLQVSLRLSPPSTLSSVAIFKRQNLRLSLSHTLLSAVISCLSKMSPNGEREETQRSERVLVRWETQRNGESLNVLVISDKR